MATRQNKDSNATPTGEVSAMIAAQEAALAAALAAVKAEEAVGAQAPKKRTARTRKTATQKSDEANNLKGEGGEGDAAASADAGETAAPKPRATRTRRTKAQIEADAAAAASAEAPAPKRGRKTKAAAAAETTVAAEGAAAKDAAPKRTRKSAKSATDGSAEAAAATPDAAGAEDAAAASAETPAPKRGRRSAKVAAPEPTPEPTQAAIAIEGDVFAGGQDAVAVPAPDMDRPRRTRRVRKVADESGSYEIPSIHIEGATRDDVVRANSRAGEANAAAPGDGQDRAGEQGSATLRRVARAPRGAAARAQARHAAGDADESAAHGGAAASASAASANGGAAGAGAGGAGADADAAALAGAAAIGSAGGGAGAGGAAAAGGERAFTFTGQGNHSRDNHSSLKKNNKQKNNVGQNGNNKHNRKERRKDRTPREYVPSVSKEELAELKLPELREKAGELNVDASGMKKADMIDAIYEALAIAEGFIEVGGILDILPDGYGFLRTQGYLPGEKDVYVGLSTIRRNGLRKGDYVFGRTRPAREGEKFAAIQNVMAVNDMPIEEAAGHRPKFADLTPIYPDERLLMEHGKNTITARVIDLVAPIGKGQRGLIVSPPKAGKTTILKDIAAAISANNPEVYLMCLLVDERPEEVTDMERSINGEVVSSTFDMPCENHIAVAELVIERAKRLVEAGRDVVILLDSITRLARAYNLAQPASGRVLSGGVDSTALYPPKRFLGAARNIEDGGSLTILASALIDTGSKMDEVIFEEFKGTGNMELKLDRSLADRRIFPAIDPITSGTRKEDLLLEPQEAPLIWGVRRLLSNMNNTERAMEMLIRSLKKTTTNQEFLMLTAKKAQTNTSSLDL